MTPDEIVKHARKYIGVPFRHMGRDEHGLDCIGLVIRATGDAGLGEYSTPPYDRHPHYYDLADGIGAHLRRVSVSGIARGDILVMRFAKYPQHVGIFTGTTIIHSYQRVGGVVEHTLDKVWRGRIYSAHRFEEFV